MIYIEEQRFVRKMVDLVAVSFVSSVICFVRKMERRRGFRSESVSFFLKS